VQYTARVHTPGGRNGGASRSSDGHLNIKLSVPGTLGTGTDRQFEIEFLDSDAQAFGFTFG
jgi:organic hydroperoxide reductase OsmC/OhrA